MIAPRDEAPVSVVIVNYRSYEELRRCLAALEAGGAAPPVVVVDHASDAAHADDVSRQFPAVTLLRLAGNEGFSAGVNRGVGHTTTPYVLLLNPDCVIEPSACAALTGWMAAQPEVGAVGPRVLNPDGTLQATARRFPDLTTAFAGRSSWLTRVLPDNPLSRHNLPAREGDHAPVDVDWVSGACLLARREAFDAIGGMDAGFFLYWEDADFCRRLELAGWRIVYLPEVTAMHVGGRSSRHSAAASQEAFHRSAFRLYWKHAGLPGRLLAPVVFGVLQLRLALMKRMLRRRPA